MKTFLTKLISPRSKQRVFGLDLLRATAIVAVLLTHAQLVYPPEERGWFGSFASISGALGVELFFVLSGFLIGSILLSLEPHFQQIKTLPHFWQRRWFRTIPNYLIFLILSILAALFVRRPIPNILSYLTFSQNWLWPHPDFFNQAWSLTVEEWFYLLFPISLFLFNKLFKSFNTAFIFSAGIFIVIPSLIRIDWALSGIPNWDANYRTIMLVRLDAIMYGVLAAWVKKSFLQFWKRQNFLLFVAGVITLYLGWSHAIGENLNASFYSKTILFSATSLGFAFILPIFDQWNNVKENFFTTAFRLIALWSYSLYLCNLLVLQTIKFMGETLGITNFAFQTFSLFMFFVISLFVSSIAYTYFEKPLTDLRDYFSKR